METLMQKMSSGRILIVSAILYCISQTIIAVILHPLEMDPLIFQITFSKSVFLEILEKWGPAGLEIFKKHYYVDFVHPFIYATFLSSSIAYVTVQLYEKPASLHRVFFSLPIIAGILDLFENVFQLIAISDPAGVSEYLIICIGAVSNTKWSLAGISILIIIYYGLRLYRKKISKD